MHNKRKSQNIVLPTSEEFLRVLHSHTQSLKKEERSRCKQKVHKLRRDTKKQNIIKLPSSAELQVAIRTNNLTLKNGNAKVKQQIHRLRRDAESTGKTFLNTMRLVGFLESNLRRGRK